MIVDRADQDVAVGERRVAIGRGKQRRPGAAAAGDAGLADDLLVRRNFQNAAVADVGDDHVAIGQLVGIVGKVEQPVLRTALTELAVFPGDLLAGEIDDLDDLRVLEIDDDALAVIGEEGIVGAGAARQSDEIVFPQDLLVGADEQDAIVAAIGDQHVVAAKRTGVVRHGSRIGRRQRRRDRRRLFRHDVVRSRQGGAGHREQPDRQRSTHHHHQPLERGVILILMPSVCCCTISGAFGGRRLGQPCCTSHLSGR